MVVAEQFHHLAGVDAKEAEESRELVCERDLRGVKALQAYFRASAFLTSTIRTGWSRKPNKSDIVVATSGSDVPTTVKGGEKKSAIPDPSRRNSGHMAVPNLLPGPFKSLLKNRLDRHRRRFLAGRCCESRYCGVQLTVSLPDAVAPES